MAGKNIQLDKLPFGKFMLIQKEFSAEESEILSKEVQITHILTGKSIDEVMDMTINELNSHIDTVKTYLTKAEKSVLKDIYTINDKEYTLEKIVSKWSAGRFIDFSHVGKDKEAPHMLIAVVLTPNGGKYGDIDIQELADDIWNHMDAWEALHILNFFTQLSLAFLKITEVYLESGKKRKMTNKDISALLKNLANGGDGSSVLKELQK